MPKRSSAKKRKRASQSAAREVAAIRVPPALLALGAVFLLVAIATSLMLALEHVGGLNLPGCGEGSPCAEAAASVWGTVPVVNWPVSYLGVAYFLGLLGAWLGCRGGVPTALRHLVRLGMLMSLGFAVIMLVEKHVCQYCLGTHVANLAFWIVMEVSRARAPRPIRPLAALCGVFVIASAALGAVEWRTRLAVQQHGEEERAASTEQIIEATRQVAAAANENTTLDPPAATQAAVEPAATTASAPSGDPTEPGGEAGETAVGLPDDWYPNGFRGRYLYGPEKAAVRLVLFTDYQCTDCYRIENEIRTLLQRHDNISLSVKHFPFCTQCNDTVKRDLHGNACWAARAAEAAGILWGNDGFWAMHHWLFDKKGMFTTTEELEAGVREIGYDPTGFVRTMMSDQTLQLVKADIAEARPLGLFETPLIFMNGVELRGWYTPNAVVRTVEAVLATNPEPQTHAHDRPVPAIEKLIGDWREGRRPRFPPNPNPWTFGAAQKPAVRILIFGDYQLEPVGEADGIIRDWMAGRTDAQYVFRQYPFNQECNPHVSRTANPEACWAARAAEAAGRLGGNQGYWRMHDWLLKNRESFSDEALRVAAGELGFDADALLAAMQEPGVEAAIRADVEAGKRLRIFNIPTIYINDRRVPRWRFLGLEKAREILEGILSEAADGQ